MNTKYIFIKKRYLEKHEVFALKLLENSVKEYDKISVKLELDYKLLFAGNADYRDPDKEYNEFFCLEGNDIIGYLGINKFGSGLPEVSGMVHHDHRKEGIFSVLFSMVKSELKRRRETCFLLLSDFQSSFKHQIIESYLATLEHIEYEMYLSQHLVSDSYKQYDNISLVKATNGDIQEITNQNSMFMESTEPVEDLLPDAEAKNGMEIYLIKSNQITIGKVHLGISEGTAGLYGFFIYPNQRGKGYGYKALDLAVKHLQNRKINRIFLQVDSTNDKAFTLYNKYGFNIESAMEYYKISL